MQYNTAYLVRLLQKSDGALYSQFGVSFHSSVNRNVLSLRLNVAVARNNCLRY